MPGKRTMAHCLRNKGQTAFDTPHRHPCCQRLLTQEWLLPFCEKLASAQIFSLGDSWSRTSIAKRTLRCQMSAGCCALSVVLVSMAKLPNKSQFGEMGRLHIGPSKQVQRTAHNSQRTFDNFRRAASYFTFVLWASKKSKICLMMSGWAQASVC
jgi:hypothetical protein